MSLNTVTLTLDNKLRSLRSSMDENTTGEDEEDDDRELGADRQQPVNAKRRSAGESGLEKRIKDEHQSLFRAVSSGSKWRAKHLTKNQPLTVFDDNIPYADESPERSMNLIPGPTATAAVQTTTITLTNNSTTGSGGGSRLPPIRQNSFKSAVTATATQKADNQNNSDQGVDGLSSSSDETDTSTTSSVQMTVDPEMLRKMNRILTNLERNTKMNRSLSLNYKNVQRGGECCCHVNHRLMQRGTSSGLTKDEKTDKNNMKKRHSQEGALNGGGGGAGGGGAAVSVGKVGVTGTTTTGGGGGGVVARRYGNRSIRRRHTVGGTHDYSPRGGGGGENYRTPCHDHVMHRSSSPE